MHFWWSQRPQQQPANECFRNERPRDWPPLHVETGGPGQAAQSVAGHWGWSSPWATLTRSCHLKGHGVLCIERKRQFSRLPRLQAMPSLIYFSPSSPDCYDIQQLRSGLEGPPLLSDGVWFPDFPNICTVIICKLSLTTLEGMTKFLSTVPDK